MKGNNQTLKMKEMQMKRIEEIEMNDTQDDLQHDMKQVVIAKLGKLKKKHAWADQFLKSAQTMTIQPKTKMENIQTIPAVV